MELISTYAPWLLTGVLSIAGYLFKDKYAQLKVCIKTFIDMIEDDKITPEEMNQFMAEAKKLIGK
jgi:hypothetical protein|tara:strand:+ start:488 stop:682 length:195 start_codon:yes stop_codon:yes gene_type:complete